MLLFAFTANLGLSIQMINL